MDVTHLCAEIPCSTDSLTGGRQKGAQVPCIDPPDHRGSWSGARAIALAEMVGAPVYFVHLSCNEAPEKFARHAIAGFPFMRKPVLNICTFPS